jgi:hypothetical protein
MSNVFFMRTAQEFLKDNDKWSLGVLFDKTVPFILFKIVMSTQVLGYKSFMHHEFEDVRFCGLLCNLCIQRCCGVCYETRANTNTLASKANLTYLRQSTTIKTRRREYLRELEEKIQECEWWGIGASAQVQAAARKVLDENRKLRGKCRY